MGYEMNYENPEEIFNEMASLTPKSYAGMTYERLGMDGLQWPCPDQRSSGNPIPAQRSICPGQRQISCASTIRIRRKCPMKNTLIF